MTAPDGRAHPVVYIRIRQRNRIARVARGQNWYWESFDTNHARMARSRGFHTNRQDAERNAQLHCGSGVTVFLQRPNTGEIPLRWGVAGGITGDTVIP